jgi:hypothetical protein
VQVCAALRKELKFTRPILQRMLRDAKRLPSDITTMEQHEQVHELFTLIMASFQRSAPQKHKRQGKINVAPRNTRTLGSAAEFRPKQLAGNPSAIFDDFDSLRAHGMGVSF